MAAGRGYAEAARAIGTLSLADTPVARLLQLPAWNALSLSVELTLKAAFLAHGGAQELLFGSRKHEGRDPIGHNLQRAFDYAVAAGWSPPSQWTGVLVARIADAHQANLFRYVPSHVNAIDTPRLGDAVDAMEKLVDAVQGVVGDPAAT